MPKQQREQLGELHFTRGSGMKRVPNVVEGGTRLVEKRQAFANAGIAADGKVVDLTPRQSRVLTSTPPTEIAKSTNEVVIQSAGGPRRTPRSVIRIGHKFVRRDK